MLTQCSRSDGALDALLRLPRMGTTNPDTTRDDARIRPSPVMEQRDITDDPQRNGSARLPVQLASMRRRRAPSSTGRSIRRSARLADTNVSPRRSPRLNRA
jgi:hypothetical protein